MFRPGGSVDVSDPETQGLLAKWAGVAFSAVLAFLGLHGWYARQKLALDTRFDAKADKDTVNAALKKVEAEQFVHRSYFTKVFDQMRENEQRAQDRHEKLLERLPAK
jgi:hypothetical protein